MIWDSATTATRTPPPDGPLLASRALAVKDGGVIAWGEGDKGQLALPGETRSGVVAVAAGAETGLALRADGTLVAWSPNRYSQLDIPAGARGVGRPRSAAAGSAWGSSEHRRPMR